MSSRKEWAREEGVKTLASTAGAFALAMLGSDSSLMRVSRRNTDLQVITLSLLLDTALSIAAAIDENILEDMQALPVEIQAMIRRDLDKIAEKTTQPPPKDSNEQH